MGRLTQVNSNLDSNTGKANGEKGRNKTVICMKVNINTTRNVVMECLHGLQETSILESIRMTKETAMERWFGLTVQYTKVSGSEVSNTAMVK